MAFDNMYLFLYICTQKSFNLKEVYKIMSFRDEMYLITFRHQCIWIHLHLIYYRKYFSTLYCHLAFILYKPEP